MAHHGDGDEQTAQWFKDLMAREAREHLLGATGSHPLGKLNADDEGELRMAVAHTADGKVVLNFGKPVAWIGFTPDQADEIAKQLQQHATEGRRLASIP